RSPGPVSRIPSASAPGVALLPAAAPRIRVPRRPCTRLPLRVLTAALRSAAITSAVRRAMPGIVSSRASCAACAAVRVSTWLVRGDRAVEGLDVGQEMVQHESGGGGDALGDRRREGGSLAPHALRGQLRQLLGGP